MHYNQQIGQLGEKLAKEFLIRHGYKIIDSNVKTSYKEIDVVARKNKITYFIEVKTRTSDIYGSAEDALNSEKVRHLKRAIIFYSKKEKLDMNMVQLDFIAVDIDRASKKAKIKHYRDIF